MDIRHFVPNISWIFGEYDTDRCDVALSRRSRKHSLLLRPLSHSAVSLCRRLIPPLSFDYRTHRRPVPWHPPPPREPDRGRGQVIAMEPGVHGFESDLSSTGARKVKLILEAGLGS